MAVFGVVPGLSDVAPVQSRVLDGRPRRSSRSLIVDTCSFEWLCAVVSVAGAAGFEVLGVAATFSF